LKMLPVYEAVSIPFHPQFIGDDGRVKANAIMLQAADAMLDELVRVDGALCALREPNAEAA
jgi:hypothetical protein